MQDRLPGQEDIDQQQAIPRAAPLGSVVEVSLQGIVNNQKVITVLHYRVYTVSAEQNIMLETGAIVDAVLPPANNNIVAPYIAVLGSNYKLQVVRAQFIHPTRYRFQMREVDYNGNSLTECEAQNLAAVLTKRTAFAGRSHIGSVHLPGVPSDAQFNGLITPAYSTLLGNLATRLTWQLVPATGGGAYQPCIFHQSPTANPRYHDLLNINVESTLRVMRRRTVGVGH